MKKALYALFTMILLFSVYSCGEEDYASEHKRALDDADWVAISEHDSIRIYFSYSATVETYDISVFPAAKKSSEYFPQWSTNGKSSMVLHHNYNKTSDPNDKYLSYNLNSEKNKLTINNLGNKTIIFDQEYMERSEFDKNYIAGTWYTTLSQDSIILVFENGTKKEYIYERNTGTILKYTDYDYYNLYKLTYTYGNKIKIEYKVWSSRKDSIYETLRCLINNNKLTIYENDYPVIYTKMK